MSGECNYCGGLHAEDGCDADRGLAYSNGYNSGEAAGHNMLSPTVAALNKENTDLHTRVAELQRRVQLLAQLHSPGHEDIMTDEERYEARLVHAEALCRAASTAPGAGT